MIKVAKKKIPKGRFYITSGEKLNFRDESFDLTFSITVLHHIPYNKKEKMIKEMCRVTRKGGYTAIMEDICFEKPKKHSICFHYQLKIIFLFLKNTIVCLLK